MNYLDAIISAQKHGNPQGITSICSAHPVVLEAAILHASKHNRPVLMEATCNQVNQFGGYTGMTPIEFRRFVSRIADKVGFPHEKLVMGGDHLGPLVWENETADSAMDKARKMVGDYARSGFGKIHLDCSMPCSDDAVLPVEVIARRTAELAKVAEDVSVGDGRNHDQLPRYVIGSEVPSAGGTKAGEDHLSITDPKAATETIELVRTAFTSLGLESAWERVIALVVQPGVEFGDEEIHAYNRSEAADLSRFIETESGIVYEAHSTDYQTKTNLRALVEDHFGILKVGPALTFAFREAVFSLAEIEEVLVESEPSHIREALEQAITQNPGYWQKHYTGTSQKLKTARFYSFSDRIRYYWTAPIVEAALNQLMRNLATNPLPLSLISQYLPAQYKKIRNGEMNNSAYELLIGQVTDVLEDYQFACSDN